ncbi:helix-turn-helix domain-containing protein [Candidatus Micrarchaeota archaeon]|nr:helix-turn-helix domain-containing protein [Candidatus Micrarchaeota archaeon]
MWIAKFKLTHDCMFLNRCKKFNVNLQSIPLTVFKIKNKVATSSIHHASGDKIAITAFIKDLKKEKGIIKLEQKGDTIFVVEISETQASRFYTPKIIFVKPVLISKVGNELWEIASWEKDELTTFMANIKAKVGKVELVKLVQETIDNVFFPRLMPHLTKNQKQALDLAIEEGYYETPRKIGLRKLAKLMQISLSTYQKHLTKAEQKLIPSTLYSSQET